MKVMIVVTHLLGTGHLSRAIILARGFQSAGHQVCLVSGGMPAAQLNSSGLNFVQLPPLRSDGVNFTRLLDAQGELANADYLQSRMSAVLELLRSENPDVLITELFPFGRRSLSDEFNALLETAITLPRRPLILSSIRDILAPPSKPAKAERADTIVGQYYDGVLVHSDPEVTRLNTSWPVSPLLSTKLLYTGYVAPVPAGPHPTAEGKGEILVSAGGGEVGGPIFRAAIEAARKMTNRRWRLLVGGAAPQARISELSNLAQGLPVLVEAARPDFRQMLNHAAVSVSMCGYNSAMDLLQSGIPAVLIPFDEGNEVEQGLRARNLAELPAFEVLLSTELDGDSLATAVTRLLATERRPGSTYRFDGAEETVRLVERMLEAKQ